MGLSIGRKGTSAAPGRPLVRRTGAPRSGIVAAGRVAERGGRQEGGTIAVRTLSDPLPAARIRAAASPSRIVATVALGVAAALVVLFPPSPLTVVAAVVATIALATEPRLGPLPAALLVALVLPWGRGADTYTWEIAGLPLRLGGAIFAYSRNS